MSDCLFCKIANKELASQMIYEDEEMVAIKDIHPQSSVHVLVIPKKHIPTLNDMAAPDLPLMGRMVAAIQKLACELKVGQSGYRVVINCNREGGQTVFHLHLHLLGGKQLGGSMVG